MYELIVLGLVPGTHIQINFEAWLRLAATFCLLVVIWRVHRAHLIRNAVISLAIFRAIRRQRA